MLRGRAARMLCLGGLMLPASCGDAGVPSQPQAARSWSGSAPAMERAFQGPVRRLRRLSSREYERVVHDLLGDVSQPAVRFVGDVYPNGYDNGSVGLAVQSDQVVDYESAAESFAAQAVLTAMPRIIGGCDPVAQGGASCLEVLLSSFAPRAFRRPLTPSEADRLRGVFAAEVAAAGFERAIQTVLEVVLQSPQFLYREELGSDGAPGVPGAAVRLTAFEVASELSFLLTGSMPDEPLWAAVLQGQFRTAEDYRREATRLVAQPAARETMRAFLHEWMATGGLAQLAKDPTFYPSFGAPLAASMSSELDGFFDDVLWNGSASLRELFTSERSFADATLALLYADGAPRPGILTRAGFLAAHADFDGSGPIARGVFVLTSIMCAPPPTRPPLVPALVPAGDPSARNGTTRQRFEQHVRDPACARCHTVIDGIGFGFEEFDGIGAHRDSENGQAVDSRGAVVGTAEIDGAFRGASELTTRLSASRVLADCYARQAYRYAMGEVERTGEDLGWLLAASSPDANVTDVLLAITKHPVFVTRRFE